MEDAAIKQLAQWLQCWDEEREAESEGLLLPPLPQSILEPPPSRYVNPFNSPDLADGEVRLLSPWLVREARRPFYVLVLKEWIDDFWLIAPFSPFSVPATPGEFDLGTTIRLCINEVEVVQAPSPLSVVSLWNAHTIPGTYLRRSWFSTVLEPHDLADILSVFLHVSTGATFPERVRERVGPDLVHPADPRHDYIAQEAAILRPLSAMAEEYVANIKSQECPGAPNRSEIEDYLLESEFGVSGFAIASRAATGGSFTMTLLVPSMGLRITLRQDSSGKKAIATVAIAATGERSYKLDGAAVVNRGRAVGKFARGRAEFKATSLQGKIGLRDPNGRPLKAVVENSRE